MLKINFKTDEEAFLKICSGNVAAYRFLFDKHFSDLCNFLLIYLHSKELAEEVALDVFANIWERKNDIQLKSTFKAYLFASSKYKAITCFHKENKLLFTTFTNDLLQCESSSDVELFVANNELRILIDNAIASLPAQSRKIYKMAWEENLSHKEIAAQLGITPKTVENHVGIALRKLRHALRPYHNQLFGLFLICLGSH